MHNGEAGAGICPHCKGGMGMDWRMMKAVRMLTAVIVIVFVFWCGMQLGEIKGSFGMNHGYGMMQMNRGITTMGYGTSHATMISTATALPTTGAGTITIQGQAVKAQ